MVEIPHTLTVEECILFSKYIDCDSIKEGDDAKQLAVQYRLMECIINRVLGEKYFFSFNPIKEKSNRVERLPYTFCNGYPDEDGSSDSWELISHDYSYEPNFEEMVLMDAGYEEVKLLSSLLGMWSTDAKTLLSSIMDDLDVYEEYFDMYNVSEDFDFEEWRLGCKHLLKKIAEASESGVTEEDILIDAAVSVSDCLYNGDVPWQKLIKNLDEYLGICFCADGLWHEILTISHKGIAKFLRVKDSIQESEEKEALEKTLEVIGQPLCFGFNYAEPIVYEDENNFFVTIPFGGMDIGDGVGADNLVPFYMTAMHMVDVLLPVVMKDI